MTDTDDTPVKKRKIKRTDAAQDIQEALWKKLRNGVSTYILSKDLQNEHQANAQIAQVDVIEAMRALGKERTEEVDVDDLTYKVTIISPEKADLDERALREAVGEEVWTQITKCSLDRTLLDNAVKAGLVDMEVLSSCITTRPITPYIRIERAKK